jgi:hypothetical protein
MGQYYGTDRVVLWCVTKAAEPDHNRSGLDKGEKVDVELVVAGRDAPELGYS